MAHRSGGVPAGTPANVYDDYLKAQDLIQRSYKDANIADACERLSAGPAEGLLLLRCGGAGQCMVPAISRSKDPKLLDMKRAETMKAAAT